MLKTKIHIAALLLAITIVFTLTPMSVATESEYHRIVNPYGPYCYEQMLIDIANLESMYPELIEVVEIGRSVEGRQILSVKLGRGTRDIIMVGSHHANEYMSSTFLMKMIDEYAYAYSSTETFGDYNIRYLLDNVTIHIVVMLNPDGVNLVQYGAETVLDRDALSQMAMVEKTYAGWKANINGVDLNRHYPAEWDVKITEPAPGSQGFKGNSPATEPEVQAMMSYSLQHDFLLAASFHTKGEVIYWADRRTERLIPGQRQIAQAVSKVTGYRLLPASSVPRIYAGGYENWFRAEFERTALCIELTPQNHTKLPHNDSNFDALVWNKAKYIGAVLALEALKLEPIPSTL